MPEERAPASQAPPRPRFLLELADTPQPDDAPPPLIRLRSLLKALLRRHGWRCVRIAEVPPGWRVAVVKPGATEVKEETDRG